MPFICAQDADSSAFSPGRGLHVYLLLMAPLHHFRWSMPFACAATLAVQAMLLRVEHLGECLFCAAVAFSAGGDACRSAGLLHLLAPGTRPGERRLSEACRAAVAPGQVGSLHTCLECWLQIGHILCYIILH